MKSLLKCYPVLDGNFFPSGSSSVKERRFRGISCVYAPGRAFYNKKRLFCFTGSYSVSTYIVMESWSWTEESGWRRSCSQSEYID